MTRLAVGIDPSTKRIAVVGAVDEPRVSFANAYTISKKTEAQDVASLGRALEAMSDFVEWANQVAPTGERVAWVEDPLLGRGGVVATMKQAYVGGIIRAALHNAGFVVRSVNVSSWKKVVTGSGAAKKPAVRQAVFAQWPKISGLIDGDGDLIDAAAIYLHGQRIHQQEHLVRGDAGPA